jgi:hypothetical protein
MMRTESVSSASRGKATPCSVLTVSFIVVLPLLGFLSIGSERFPPDLQSRMFLLCKRLFWVFTPQI